MSCRKQVSHLGVHTAPYASISLPSLFGYFFFPFDLLLDPDAEFVEVTLEAREDGAAELALLAPLMLSKALFYYLVVSRDTM
jgi:hypothetical protein